MAERIDTTRGIVLKRSPFGEANTLVTLFTEDFGLVYALAQSSRREESKLRFGLMPLASGRYSLVFGNRYRLIGVETEPRGEITSAYLRTAGRVAALLVRLLPGGDAHPSLFSSVNEGLSLMREGSKDEELMKNLECILVLRTLEALGYLPALPEFAPFTEGPVTEALAARLSSVRTGAIRTINTSLSQTGL